MKARQVSEHVWALHADAQTEDLFEGIWPIKDGVSLNSYLVRGKKTALIDLVRDWVGAPKILIEELASLKIKPADIDYLVINHMEPDHTGWLEGFRALAPKAQIIASEKALPMIKNFYGIEEGISSVKTGDTLDLGEGMVLSFFDIPNVHWPETMASYLEAEGVLFSCDAFGSFGKLGERVFDDEYSPEEHEFFEKESLRYYANIVSSFSIFVQRAITKLNDLPIRVVAPSHGIIWRAKPLTIIERYAKYASYMNGPAEKEICVVWGSMYGNTEQGLMAVIKGVRAEGVPYSIHRVPNEDVSYVLADAYKSKGILIAMPTYEYKMFPPMAYALSLFERKHVWNRTALRIGSFGWSGGAKKEYEEAIAPLKWTSIDSVEWAGKPDDDLLELLEQRGRELARAVKGD